MKQSWTVWSTFLSDEQEHMLQIGDQIGSVKYEFKAALDLEPTNSETPTCKQANIMCTVLQVQPFHAGSSGYSMIFPNKTDGSRMPPPFTMLDTEAISEMDL